MGTRDSRVDAYIANSAEFARPILTFLREVAHKACPEICETMKWSAPFFVRKSIVCSMMAFKAHCSLNFWKGALVVPKNQQKRDAMGQFGKITTLKDLPNEKTLLAYFREAARLDEAGVKRQTQPLKPKPAAVPPDDLLALLRKHKKAATTFENFSPSHQREYVEWIIDAKREETRQKRLQQTIAWLAEGKPHNWKYQRC
jgi:uncharacterized protein YdeI (YjbR/CyaY-like superfamily)